MDRVISIFSPPPPPPPPPHTHTHTHTQTLSCVGYNNKVVVTNTQQRLANKPLSDIYVAFLCSIMYNICGSRCLCFVRMKHHSNESIHIGIIIPGWPTVWHLDSDRASHHNVLISKFTWTARYHWSSQSTHLLPNRSDSSITKMHMDAVLLMETYQLRTYTHGVSFMVIIDDTLLHYCYSV